MPTTRRASRSRVLRSLRWNDLPLRILCEEKEVWIFPVGAAGFLSNHKHVLSGFRVLGFWCKIFFPQKKTKKHLLIRGYTGSALQDVNGKIAYIQMKQLDSIVTSLDPSTSMLGSIPVINLQTTEKPQDFELRGLDAMPTTAKVTAAALPSNAIHFTQWSFGTAVRTNGPHAATSYWLLATIPLEFVAPMGCPTQVVPCSDHPFLVTMQLGPNHGQNARSFSMATWRTPGHDQPRLMMANGYL